MIIEDIDLKIVSDSRGENTLEAIMKSGAIEVKSSVPQGKSRSEKEVSLIPAVEAEKKFNAIKPEILARDFKNLKEFDHYLIDLDATKNKSFLGGNLTLVLSQCFCRLQSLKEGKELYQYLGDALLDINPFFSKISQNKESHYLFFFFNLINGGKHADSGPVFQEYMIVPQVDNPKISLEIAQIFFAGLKSFFQKEYEENYFGDEGGLIISEDDYEKPLIILEKVRKGLQLEDKIKFALDIAASSFYQKEENLYLLSEKKKVSSGELKNIYQNLVLRYDIISLEDPFEENDWQSFQESVSLFGKKTDIIGDDLTATDKGLVERAGQTKSTSGVIIKPTQIGTVYETLETIVAAHQNNLKIIVSHRSAETEDDFIADLAMAARAWGIKAGAPQPKERMVKYKRVIEIIKHKTHNTMPIKENFKMN